MPYQSVWRNPERLLRRKGVSVYHTYKNDDIDDTRRDYWFVTNSQGGEEESFDVRDLATYGGCTEKGVKYASDVEEHKHIRNAIMEAIDRGILTCDGVNNEANEKHKTL